MPILQQISVSNITARTQAPTWNLPQEQWDNLLRRPTSPPRVRVSLFYGRRIIGPAGNCQVSLLATNGRVINENVCCDTTAVPQYNEPAIYVYSDEPDRRLGAPLRVLETIPLASFDESALQHLRQIYMVRAYYPDPLCIEQLAKGVESFSKFEDILTTRSTAMLLEDAQRQLHKGLEKNDLNSINEGVKLLDKVIHSLSVIKHA